MNSKEKDIPELKKASEPATTDNAESGVAPATTKPCASPPDTKPEPKEKPQVASATDAADTADDDLSGQLEGLRGELDSKLPGPERFLTFEKALEGRERNEIDENDPMSPGRFPNSPRLLLRYGVIFLLIATIVAAAAFIFMRVEIPQLIGVPAVEASETIRELGLDFEIFEEESADAESGTIISTTPGPGEAAFRGTTVVLRVAINETHVSVPDIRGMTLAQARETLTGARLDTRVIQTFDSTVPQGNVVGFLPVQGSSLPIGSTVTVMASSGVVEEPLSVPRVIGLDEASALTVLSEAGFNPSFFYAASTRGEDGQVISQTPGEGNMVNPGSPILVLISTGTSTTDLQVPDITGETDVAASTIMEEAGFVPEAYAMVDTEAPLGSVISQMPPRQDMLLRSGERLGFLVSRGESTAVEVPSILGLDQTSALEQLRSLGLNPVTVLNPELTQGEQTAGAIITQQFPAGGSQYHLGLPVLLYVSLQD